MNSPKGRFVGLVDASGPGGAMEGDSGDWRLVFHLAAWREPEGGAVQRALRCELHVEKSDLNTLMAEIEPYDIVELEAADTDDGVTRLQRIVSTTATDTELESIRKELQKPINLLSPFGRLLYDRGLGWYAGTAVWCGEEIDITLACADPAEAGAVLKVASELFSDQPTWSQRVRDCAVQNLLELKNDAWLEEDEQPVSAEEFTSRMTLTSIAIEENGDFTFWHDDGELFFGHSIEVSGDLVKGPDRADIPG